MRRVDACGESLAARGLGRLILVLVLLAVGPCGCLEDKASESEPRSAFDWSAFLPEAAPGTDGVDWEEIADGSPYRAFDQIRRSLVRNTITADAMSAFEAITHDPRRLTRIRDTLARLEGDQRIGAIRALYADLMLADSNPDILHEYLTKTVERAFELAAETPDDNGRRFAWAIGVANYSALIAYQATGDRRFLALVGEALERILAERDSEIGRLDEVRGRILPSWGGTRYHPEGLYSTNITIAGRVSFLLTLFAQIVRADPDLDQETHDRSTRFIKAAQSCMDAYEEEFRVVPGTDRGYYHCVTDDGVEPLNHMAWAGNALILLHELTGDARYGRMARQLANYFRHSMWIDENGCLVWRYRPTPTERDTPKWERVWKARTTAQFPRFAYEHDVVFTRDDMERIAHMFTTNVYRDDGRVSYEIASRFRDMELKKHWRGGYLSTTPFIVFEECRPEIRQIVEQMVASRPDTGGWLRGNHGLVAYAYRLK